MSASAPVSVDGRWVYRSAAAEFLNIDLAALTLLLHNGHAPPDCFSCGKIRWRAEWLIANRDGLRQVVADNWPDLLHPDNAE